jgi:hypothetical protein
MAPDSPAEPFEARDRIRSLVTAAHLKGRGIEIGAGAFPSKLPDGATAVHYDLRTREELMRLFDRLPEAPVRSLDQIRSDFPDGAPFLIAHNVLEHAADPIGTLIDWHMNVADGGVVIISLPDKNACPDKQRLEPPLSHLLLDHLLRRDQHAFESKEHIALFNLGWAQENQAAADESGRALARWILPQLFERNSDVHWHAFTQSLAEKTVLAACALAGQSAELLAKADFTTTPEKTLGDIILVYRLRRTQGESRGFHYSISRELDEVRASLSRALRRLEGEENDSAVADASSADAVYSDTVYPAWICIEDRPDVLELEGPFVRELGHCFVVSGLLTHTPGDCEAHPGRSVYRVFEDGVALGPAHALHAEIREQGRGRFSHWRNALYFSTSDNSDPNLNGRKYELRPEK